MVPVPIWIRQLLARQEGQGMIEYGLVVSLIAIATMVAITAMSGALSGLFMRICEAVAQGPC